jgi:hypothetical protein
MSGPLLVVGTGRSKSASFAAHGHSQFATWCQEPATTCISEHRLHTLLICWYQEASLSTEHRGPVLSTMPSHGRAPIAPSKSRIPALPLNGNLPLWGAKRTAFTRHKKAQHSHCAWPWGVPASPLKSGKGRFPTEGRKALNFYLLPQGAQRPSTSHCACPQESSVSPSMSWNPSFSTEWQSVTLQVTGGLHLMVHRGRPSAPLLWQWESPFFPIKEWNPSSLAEERDNLTTTRTLQVVTLLSYPSLKKTDGIPGEKAQNTNHRGMRD